MNNLRYLKFAATAGCYWVVLYSLIASAPARAEMCNTTCSFPTNPFESTASTGLTLLFATAASFNATSDASTDSPSKHYTQAVKDDAAIFIATDQSFDGPMLESAWRKHQQHDARQKSKKAFAEMVLMTY
ncbi:DUF2388 domain-containing protein [Pseudomonas sp. MYb118]|uniref:DUF2388 domain-containing protein n=1 Tax=Pseudomonas sp. MYb118 TaxID=1848720 RepID=UPI0034CFC629